MPKKATTPPQQSPLKLVILREDAEEKVQDRIKKGQELHSRQISAWDQLESVRNDYYTWSDYNRELLKGFFTNDSVSEEYEGSYFKIAVSGSPVLLDEVEDFRRDVSEKIRRLESIQNRLEIIPLDPSAVLPESGIKQAGANLKPLTKPVVYKAAVAVMKAMGHITTLDVKNNLREAGYNAIQAEVSATVSELALENDWSSVQSDNHRVYKLAEKTNSSETMNSSKKVFIGHGGSRVWKDLKDFLQDRLNLSWDEFSREPTAGYSTKERLESMLTEARFAFIIMTAEDEHVDQKKHARENVIHEIGLFQGHLGFKKAIILLEEGCEEFSNIVGLSQIRFPAGNIEAKFEEIRRVLERERIM